MLCTRPPFPSGWYMLPTTPANLTLANTLPVGQSFLWHRHALSTAGPSPIEEYSRALHSPPRVVCLRQSPSHLYYTAIHPIEEGVRADLAEGTTKRWLEDYFHLSAYPDLVKMYTDWRERDPGLFGKTELDEGAIGVRVLRQDPWECLIA